MPHLEFETVTSYEDALERAADECGIEREYWDIFHNRHQLSAEGARRLLQALGWDVSSVETIERERARRFEEKFASPLLRTMVIGEFERSVPLTLAVSSEGSLHFEILLEDGQRLEGTIPISDLHRTSATNIPGEQWITYQLPLPSELPLGYHTLGINLGNGVAQSNLIVCPNRTFLPEALENGGRTAGFNIALYGLRSRRNWGCGDFTDLRGLAEWAHNDLGFSLIGLNPLHALHNRVPYNTSPYLPLSIFYKNLIYIDIESVPEFAASSRAQELFHSPRVQRTIRQLRDAEFVRYQEIDQLKRRFLKLLHAEFRRASANNPARVNAFAQYCDREGDLLDKFALYCALDEILHKQDPSRWSWRDWPSEFQTPESDACRDFAKRHARTVEFYKYIQFLIEEQLSAAQEFVKQRGLQIGLYHDLALATDSSGSDLWAYRRFYVNGCRVGAPPDDFSPQGQDWGFPPPNALVHRENGYRLYRESIRKIMRDGGALRIDHVMRLFRLFWIPDGASAAEGTYVRDNATDLLRILALESVRNQSVVIGEDLGTVTDEIRDALANFGILSYRLFYFEKHARDRSFKRSDEYPRQALVASATHDLPTLEGFWTGRDIEARKAAGLIDDAGYRNQIEEREGEKQRMLDVLHAENLLPHDYARDARDVPKIDGPLHNGIIGFLAQVPSMILLLNQEDFTKETEQQNLPGSTEQYPNWQRKMKVELEDLRSPACEPFTAMFRHQLTRTGRGSY